MQNLKRTVLVTIRRGESGYVADSADVPIVTQGATLDELAANIREAIALLLDGEDPADFGLVAEPVVLATFELNLAA